MPSYLQVGSSSSYISILRKPININPKQEAISIDNSRDVQIHNNTIINSNKAAVFSSRGGAPLAAARGLLFYNNKVLDTRGKIAGSLPRQRYMPGYDFKQGNNLLGDAGTKVPQGNIFGSHLLAANPLDNFSKILKATRTFRENNKRKRCKFALQQSKT